MHPDEHPDIKRVLAEEDPARRAKLVGELSQAHQAAINMLAPYRRDALDELVAKGFDYNVISKLTGLSSARISQIRSSGPSPERSLLGSGVITVALGGKTEGDKEKPGPVVSQEDFIAYEYLRESAAELGLTTRYEVISPPGLVNLNRPNLIVVCGPRLSPFVGQILERDPQFGFESDQAGWYLVDRPGERILRSPMDAGTSEDYAYLGRLPRPDGKGAFMYCAGVHAPGCAGAIHYLIHNLAELYKATKRGSSLFSVLVHCAFNPDTRQITSSTAVTDVQLWKA